MLHDSKGQSNGYGLNDLFQDVSFCCVLIYFNLFSIYYNEKMSSKPFCKLNNTKMIISDNYDFKNLGYKLSFLIVKEIYSYNHVVVFF